MKRKLLSVFLALAMVLPMLSALPLTAAAEGDMPWEGSGTKKDPYKISTRQELEAIADAVNAGNDLMGVYFEQTAHIYLGGKAAPWPVIGHVIGNTPHPFNGVYNGRDYNIYGLFVGTLDEDGDPVGVNNEDAGLFGHIGERGEIRRVHVVDCQVYTKALYVGGIAGRNDGLVEYCSSDATDPEHSSGIIKGSWQYAGGIVGYNFGMISYCYSNCDVLGAQKVGGITGGQNGGAVANCYFRGYVFADDITRAYAGGIAGENDGNSTIDNCYTDASVGGRNENAYCGTIAGSNDTGSTVGNCFWEDSEGTGVPGIGSGMGDTANVGERTAEQFQSGEVAWELSRGENGEGWGQTLEDDDGNHDNHPHFTEAPDKDYDTTAVYRVTFKYHMGSTAYDRVVFVDPDKDINPLPDLSAFSPNAKWYLVDVVDGIDQFQVDENGLLKEFDGNVIDHDVDVVAAERVFFAGEEAPITKTVTYSTEAQVIGLDDYIQYAERGPSPDGKFEYTILSGNEELNATFAANGITIPAGTNVKDGGYTLTINAHEKKPFFATFIALFSPGNYGTEDVTLTVNIIIEKATPAIDPRPTATTINYGQALALSTLSGGKAQHPTTGANVPGRFAWKDVDTIPTVNQAATIGYYVTFTPADTRNYNSVDIMVPFTVNKVPPEEVIPPAGIESTYNGKAEPLVKGGSAVGGDMKYWLAESADDEPDEDTEFSATIPARANVGTYYIWYKVVGDENHLDTEPQRVQAVIRPYPLTIEAQHVTYNGSDTFTLTLPGVEVADEDASRTVVATLKASSMNADTYEYADNAGKGLYTVELSNSNYVVAANPGALTIDPLPVVLHWNAPLVFPANGETHQVTASIKNILDKDTCEIAEYSGNKAEEAGDYTAKAVSLTNKNYTLNGVQNAEQVWHIIDRNESVILSGDDLTYGETLKLTVKLSPETTAAPEVSATLTADEADAAQPMGAADDEDDPNDPDHIKFTVNGVLIASVPVHYDEGTDDTATVIYEVPATAAYNFSAGANAVLAEYTGNRTDAPGGKDAITVTVGQKPITATITGSTEKTYDGNAVATGAALELNSDKICANGNNANGKDDVTVTVDSLTYNSANVKESATITANNAMLSGAQSGNYKLAFAAEKGRINPKTVKLEWRGVSDRIYDGTSSNVTATATELIPGDGEACGVVVTNGSQSHVGKYTAEATELDNPNYALPGADTTREYEIFPASLYIPELHVPYDGNAQFTVKNVEGINGDMLTVLLTAASPNVGEYGYSDGGTAPGLYTAAMDANSDYAIAGGAILYIEKVPPTYTPPAAIEGLKENGAAQALVTAGTAKGGTMLYSLSKDGPYSESIPTGVEAGAYTVWYMVVGDENHSDTEPRSVEVTILKDTPNEPEGPGNTDDPNKPDEPVDPDEPGRPGRPGGSGSSLPSWNSPQGSTDHAPATGDESSLALWAALMLLSMAGLAVFSPKRVKGSRAADKHRE